MSKIFVDSYPLYQNHDEIYYVMTSAFDIDDDSAEELIVVGAFSDGFWIYAFNEGFEIAAGWPHHIDILEGQNPISSVVFGDIDGDGELEFLITSFGVTESYIYAWNLDGSTYLPGSSIFITSPNPSWMNKPLLADITGDGITDILTSSRSNLFPWEDPGFWLFAWDASGDLLEDFPITLSGDEEISNILTVPLINDLDDDGTIDVVVPITYIGNNLPSRLLFMEFPGVSFDTCNAPTSSWRYNRDNDGIGPSYGPCRGFLCGDVNHDWKVDTSDVDYMVDYLFGGGPPPDPMESGDVDCYPGVNIGDLVWLVDYVYNNGPAPCECGRSAGAPNMAKTNDHEITFEAVYEDGKTFIMMSSPIDLRALQLEFNRYVTDVPQSTDKCSPGLLFGDAEENKKIGILDLAGERLIPAGNHDLLSIKGDYSLVSVLAIDGDNNVVQSRINSVVTALPTEFMLYQNYPNPFNPVTGISFSLPVASDVTLEVFNINGQKVATVVQDHFEAGTHRVIWNGTDHASGVYLYKINAGDFTDTKKMLLIK